MHRLIKRETIQTIAALRLWGRWMETMKSPDYMPHLHPMVAARFTEAKVLPMTLDEIETLIGKLDGSYKGRGLRPWNPIKFL